MGDFVAGLDLGQTYDSSALVIVERIVRTEAEPLIDVRHAQRWKIGTSYPQIVDDVVRMMCQSPLDKACPLIIDGTGVGRGIVDSFYAHKDWDFPIRPVTITSGGQVSFDGRYTHVPKVDLVDSVQLLLQNRRLRFASTSKVPEMATLISELDTFQSKRSVATGNESFGAWREHTHDDVILALALAVWYVEQRIDPANLLAFVEY